MRAADGLRDLYAPRARPTAGSSSPSPRRSRVDEPDAAFTGHVALFRAAGGAFVRDLSFGPDANPTWSPDGRRVAFERGGAIHVVDVGDRRRRGGWSGARTPPGGGGEARAIAWRAGGCSRSRPPPRRPRIRSARSAPAARRRASSCAPRGIAVDANGYVYVADSDAHRVTKFAPDGRVVRVIGNPDESADFEELRDDELSVADGRGRRAGRHTSWSPRPPGTPASRAGVADGSLPRRVRPTFGVDPGPARLAAGRRGRARRDGLRRRHAATTASRPSPPTAPSCRTRRRGRRRGAGLRRPVAARAAWRSTRTARSGSPTAPGTSSSTTPPTARSSASSPSTAIPASRTAPPASPSAPATSSTSRTRRPTLVRRWSDAGAQLAPVGNGEGEAAGRDVAARVRRRSTAAAGCTSPTAATTACRCSATPRRPRAARRTTCCGRRSAVRRPSASASASPSWCAPSAPAARAPSPSAARCAIQGRSPGRPARAARRASPRSAAS